MVSSSSAASAAAIIPSSMTWLLVFIPALVYFLSTRVFYSSYNDGSSSNTNGIAIEMGTILSDRIICYDSSSTIGSNTNTVSSNCCTEFSNFFYLKECSNSNMNSSSSIPFEILLLKNGLRNVQNQLSETIGTTTTTTTTNSLQVPVDTCDSVTSSTDTISTGSSSIVDMQWIHDNDIGRGYLLYSIENKIWRWEKGGGPIPIGRTLHLDNAGCRSPYYISCTSTTSSTTTSSSSFCNSDTTTNTNNNMVGGISIIQKYTSTSFTDTAATSTTTTNSNNKGTTTTAQQTILSTSKLITDNLIKSITISEWGEGRIVRLESETGARTPLLYFNDIPIQEQMLQHQHYSKCTIIFSNNINNNNSNSDTSSTNEKNTSSTFNIYTIPKPERILHTPDGHLLVVLDVQCEYNNDNDVNTESVVQQQQQMESRRNRRITKDDKTDTTSTSTTVTITTTSIIVQVTNAIHIPSLLNLKQSRIAHSLTTINYTTAYNDSLYTIGPPKIIYFNNNNNNNNVPYKINSIALSTSGQSIYMTVQQSQTEQQQQETIQVPDELLIQELSIVEIDDDDDDENDNAGTVSTDGTVSVIEEGKSDSTTTSAITTTATATTICNVSDIIQTMIQQQQEYLLQEYSVLSSLLSINTMYQIGDIVVSQSGTIIVAINTDHNNYVMIIKKKKINNLDTMKEVEQQQWISSFIPIQSTNKVDTATGSTATRKEASSSSSSSRITALEIGTDGYLYIAISSHFTHSLNRIRIKDKPIR